MRDWVYMWANKIYSYSSYPGTVRLYFGDIEIFVIDRWFLNERPG
jgi:hypothetical protein